MSEPWGRAEMEHAAVWDRRCITSLTRICERLSDQPGAAFSTACGSDGRQAAHRIFEHPTTTVAGLLQGHYAQTAQRCQAAAADGELILVAQDTTSFNYDTHPATTGLGLIGDGRAQGLLAHSALALTSSGLPLGLLHLELWARDPATRGQRRSRASRPTAEKESQKWLTGLAAVEAALPASQPVLVIQDREADVFAFLAAPRRPNTQLLLRAGQPRQVSLPPCRAVGKAPAVGAPPGAAPATGDLLTVASQAPVVGTLTVRVPRAPGRPLRDAVLTLRATPVQIQAPRWRKGRARQQACTPVTLWVVRATEAHPPPGAEAIDWVLVTTLPCGTAAAAQTAVGYYAKRWLIERLHFTLKSGLRVERLQFDDATSLGHALALYYVVAWRLLWLTYLARTAPEAPACWVVNETEQVVLAQATGAPVPTCRAAVRAIAKLGGFPGNPAAGEPGLKTLWLGLMRLEAMVVGWCLAHGQSTATIQD